MTPFYSQVSILFYDETLIAPLKELAVHSTKLVVTVREGRLQPFHPIDEVSLWSSDHQMEVVGHHAVPFQYPSAFFASLEEASLKRLMRPIVDEQILSVVASIDDVINSVFPFDS